MSTRRLRPEVSGRPRSRRLPKSVAATGNIRDGVGVNGDLVQQFVDHGFVKLEQAFPAEVAEACAQLLWAEIGVDAHDPSSWSKPVYWVGDMAQEPFRQAANTPQLHDAFDALVGPGRWAPRASLGSFPLRFPHPDEPDDAGWHVEGSYQPSGANSYWLNMYSAHRALLMLFLFTEVDAHNAPTRIRVGSHMDIPPLLRPYGERGVSMFRIARQVDTASTYRPLALATGRPGDVYLCHPFLVHAAQPHHGHRPRFMAQPPLYPATPFDLTRPDAELSPVERTIRDALRDQPADSTQPR